MYREVEHDPIYLHRGGKSLDGDVPLAESIHSGGTDYTATEAFFDFKNRFKAPICTKMLPLLVRIKFRPCSFYSKPAIKNKSMPSENF